MRDNLFDHHDNHQKVIHLDTFLLDIVYSDGRLDIALDRGSHSGSTSATFTEECDWSVLKYACSTLKTTRVGMYWVDFLQLPLTI